MIYFADCILHNDAVDFEVSKMDIEGDIDMRRYKYFSKNPYERLFIYEYLHNNDKDDLSKILNDIKYHDETYVHNIKIVISTIIYHKYVLCKDHFDNLHSDLDELKEFIPDINWLYENITEQLYDDNLEYVRRKLKEKLKPYIDFSFLELLDKLDKMWDKYNTKFYINHSWFTFFAGMYNYDFTDDAYLKYINYLISFTGDIYATSWLKENGV